MKVTEGRTDLYRSTEGHCDIRTWSGECKHDDYSTLGDKYLCASCGKIDNLEHMVRQQGFPHVSGDYDNLS